VTNDVLLPRYGQASTTAKLKVIASGLEQGVTYILPVTLDKAQQTDDWSVADTLAAYVVFKQTDYDPNGPGTVNNPYSITTVDDLKAMDSKMMEGLMVYFRLENDLDLSGETEWTALNAAPYKPFSLDGAGHTISNLTASVGLFEAVVGDVHDLNVENVKVTMTVGLPAGILGCYGGSDDFATTIKNVYVQGKIVNEKVHGTGGMFGIIRNTTIDACAANVTLLSTKYDVGGIYGYDASNVEKNHKSVVSNCWTAGECKGNRMVGGIAGMLSSTQTECAILNCYTTAEVHAQFQYGGIVGNALMGGKSGNATVNPKQHVERCLAWNKSVYTDNNDETLHYSSGAIVGYTALKNYHVDCYRKFDLIFKECNANSFNVLYDQENSSPENPLVEAVEGQYNFPYHGKAAAEGATASQVAKALGWSESIWDLSGDLPFFKGGDAPVIVSDDEANGQLPDFDENEFYN